MVMAGTRLMTGLQQFGRDLFPLQERREQTTMRRLQSEWLQAQAWSAQTICSRFRARKSSCPGVVAECLGGQRKLLLSSSGSEPAPAASSHLPHSSSPAGKGKPGISCSQHIPGIYLVGLLLQRPLLMKDTDLEQAFG